MAHKKTATKQRPPKKELVKSWFPPEYKQKLERAAKKSRLSTSLYVALAIMRHLDETR